MAWLVLRLGSNAAVRDGGIPVFVLEQFEITLPFYPFKRSVETPPILNVLKLECLLMRRLCFIQLNTGPVTPPTCILRKRTLIFTLIQ